MSMADRVAVMHEGRVAQLDSPVDLYQRPRSVVVADFIGTSNRFSGTLVDGGLDVPGIGVLRGTATVPLPAKGTPGHLVVRPEETRVVPAGEGMVTGRVAQTQFFGGVSTVAVVVPGLENPFLVTRPGASDLRRDDDVALSWDATRAVLLGG